MAYPVEIWPDSLPESIFGVCHDVLAELVACLLFTFFPQVWGLYFLRGSYSCMRPFSENLRLCGAVGVPVVPRCPENNFWRICDCRLFGFPGHSSWCPGVPTTGVPVRRFRCGVKRQPCVEVCSLQAPGPLRQVSLCQCQWAPLSIKSGSWDGRHL